MESLNDWQLRSVDDFPSVAARLGRQRFLGWNGLKNRDAVAPKRSLGVIQKQLLAIIVLCFRTLAVAPGVKFLWR